MTCLRTVLVLSHTTTSKCQWLLYYVSTQIGTYASSLCLTMASKQYRIYFCTSTIQVNFKEIFFQDFGGKLLQLFPIFNFAGVYDKGKCNRTTTTAATKTPYQGSGCGSVGRAVAYDAKGLRFESSHRQTFIIKNINLMSTVLKRQKIKRARKWPIKNHIKIEN